MPRIWSQWLGGRVLSGRKPDRNPPLVQPFGPVEGPVYLVGDLHGCLSLYRAMERAILADAQHHAGRPTVVLLGDVVDRGPSVAGLLDMLVRPNPALRRLAVMGNHEAMMLDFLSNPHKHTNWLGHGGFETLRSYGLALTPADLDSMSRKRAQQVLAAHIPDEHIDWIRGLPSALRADLAGNAWIFAHAGYDPGLRDEDQTAAILHWGQVRPDDRSPTGLVHGHVVVAEPDVSARRINVDTGAFMTGTLTACRFTQTDGFVTFAVSEKSG